MPAAPVTFDVIADAAGRLRSGEFGQTEIDDPAPLYADGWTEEAVQAILRTAAAEPRLGADFGAGMIAGIVFAKAIDEARAEAPIAPTA